MPIIGKDKCKDQLQDTSLTIDSSMVCAGGLGGGSCKVGPPPSQGAPVTSQAHWAKNWKDWHVLHKQISRKKKKAKYRDNIPQQFIPQFCRGTAGVPWRWTLAEDTSWWGSSATGRRAGTLARVDRLVEETPTCRTRTYGHMCTAKDTLWSWFICHYLKAEKRLQLTLRCKTFPGSRCRRKTT